MYSDFFCVRIIIQKIKDYNKPIFRANEFTFNQRNVISYNCICFVILILHFSDLVFFPSLYRLCQLVNFFFLLIDAHSHHACMHAHFVFLSFFLSFFAEEEIRDTQVYVSLYAHHAPTLYESVTSAQSTILTFFSDFFFLCAKQIPIRQNAVTIFICYFFSSPCSSFIPLNSTNRSRIALKWVLQSAIDFLLYHIYADYWIYKFIIIV